MFESINGMAFISNGFALSGVDHLLFVSAFCSGGKSIANSLKMLSQFGANMTKYREPGSQLIKRRKTNLISLLASYYYC
ncbi:hypothetical protein PanWU01x14_359500 [Parasponia andersonii]|uniref:Uncharacterized protein n=1 Tax=Parasponia andersonii TaxID=3476 RepID=A0A2P5A7Z5_PARAD|nr:hypothetical protein PanWU01x14_359500 [Parasponia andersonii]